MNIPTIRDDSKGLFRNRRRHPHPPLPQANSSAEIDEVYDHPTISRVASSDLVRPARQLWAHGQAARCPTSEKHICFESWSRLSAVPYSSRAPGRPVNPLLSHGPRCLFDRGAPPASRAPAISRFPARTSSRSWERFCTSKSSCSMTVPRSGSRSPKASRCLSTERQSRDWGIEERRPLRTRGASRAGVTRFRDALSVRLRGFGTRLCISHRQTRIALSNR